MVKVGIYLGTIDDSTENIERLVTDWGDYLGDTVDLEAFGSAPFPGHLNQNYKKVNTTPRQSRTPFGKITDVFRDGIEYINKRNPDVIINIWKYHTHAPGIALAGWHTDTPTITRVTGDVYHEYEQYVGYKRFGVYLLDNVIGYLPPHLSDKIITLGPYEKNEVIKRGTAPEHIVILPPPNPDPNKFFPPKEKCSYKTDLGLPTTSPIALYVGRISDQKGMAFLIEAMRDVLSKKEMTFVLVGKGAKARNLKQEFGENVLLPGQIPHKYIDMYYKAADLYIHPSPFEGVPLVILEALSCGLPSVARPVGDIPFILRDQDLVNDPKEMADWIVDEPTESILKNEEYFTDQFQTNTIIDLVISLNKKD